MRKEKAQKNEDDNSTLMHYQLLNFLYNEQKRTYHHMEDYT